MPQAAWLLLLFWIYSMCDIITDVYLDTNSAILALFSSLISFIRSESKKNWIRSPAIKPEGQLSSESWRSEKSISANSTHFGLTAWIESPYVSWPRN